VIVAASVLLGAVFVVAGVTKVSAPQQWRIESAAIGVHRLIAAFVPFLELMIGALLVAQIARRPVALVAGVVLLTFTLLLILRLSQGRRPPCACFGALTTKPIGWGNVARNATFIVLASVIALH
jgi:uncharacterized membrane protein YphA (DoxX/SURF4 family)